MGINPEVTFEHDGQVYEGEDVGIFAGDNGSTKVVVKSDSFDKFIRVNENKVSYENDMSIDTKNKSNEGDIMSRPGYSVNENGQWVAYSVGGEKVSSHDTHTKLKDYHQVESAKSPDEDSEEYEKYDYKLIYCPADLT